VPAVALLLCSIVPGLPICNPAPGKTAPTVPLLANGRSVLVKVRNVGAAAAPVVGPAKTRFASCVSNEEVIVAEKLSGYATENAIGVESLKTILLMAA